MRIRVAQLFDGTRLRQDVALVVDNGLVSAVEVATTADLHQIDYIVCPGYIDLQVNGGGGTLFNTDPTRDGLRKLAQAHAASGTRHLLPTIISDTPQVMRAAAEAIATSDVPGVLGLHLEGPHIAESRRGTHDARYLRPLDDTTLEIVHRLQHSGKCCLVTVAPEIVPPEEIAKLASLGAIVSIGHTDADAATCNAAFAAGARMVTHLFNAMSQLAPRAPGCVGATLESGMAAGLICDGIHVDATVMRIAHHVMRGRLCLVSDSMATWNGPDTFLLYGAPITLQDGRLVNSEGRLAGAHLSLETAVRQFVTDGVGTVGEALTCAITAPAAVVGRADLAGVVGRPLHDLICVDSALRYVGNLSEHSQSF